MAWIDVKQLSSSTSGTSAWPIAYYQDPNGSMRTIYGDRHFYSHALDKTTTNLGTIGRFEKIVRLIPLTWKPRSKAGFFRAPEWKQLPNAVRSSFENGLMLVTEGEDLFENHEEFKKFSGWATLFYAGINSTQEGRGGVLVWVEDMSIEPVTVEVAGKEFVVELKGCGTSAGGFGPLQFRALHFKLSGAIELGQAEIERNQMPLGPKNGGPFILGSLRHQAGQQEYGYTIRATPSTLRLSFGKNVAFPLGEDAQVMKTFCELKARELVEHISRDRPMIMDRSYHSENILLWGEHDYTYTDFADHAAFDDPRNVYMDVGLGVVSPHALLRKALDTSIDDQRFDVPRDQPIFFKAIRQSLKEQSIPCSEKEWGTPFEAAEDLWQQYVAIRVHDARKEVNFFASKIFQDAVDAPRYLQANDIPLDGESILAYLELCETSFSIPPTNSSILQRFSLLVDAWIKASSNPQLAQARELATPLINYWYANLFGIYDYFLQERDILQACLHTRQDDPSLKKSLRLLDQKINHFHSLSPKDARDFIELTLSQEGLYRLLRMDQYLNT